MRLSIALSFLMISFVTIPINAEDLTLLLRIQANFDQRRMVITEVNPNGPAAKLRNDRFPRAVAEPGDVIEAIDGKAIATHEDFVEAMNSSLDGNLKLTIRNVNDGQSMDFWTQAEPKGKDPFSIMKDGYFRAVKTDSVPMSPFGLSIGENRIVSMIGTTLAPILQEEPTPEEQYRNLMVGYLQIQQNKESAKIFDEQTYNQCDQALRKAMNQIFATKSEPERRKASTEAVETVLGILRKQLELFGKQTGRRVLEEATTPKLVVFRPVSEVKNANVQIMPVADKILTLLRLEIPIDQPLTELAVDQLNRSIQWKTLPMENASAYGRYYYRFSNGDAAPPLNQFEDSRQITVTPLTLVNGEILFRR